MEIIDADYGYIVLLAFQDLLAFENKRTLTFTQIHEYRKLMLEFAKEHFF